MPKDDGVTAVIAVPFALKESVFMSQMAVDQNLEPHILVG